MISRVKSLKNHQGFMRYFKNTSWLFAEKILRMVVALVVGVLVARYLGPEQFGLLSYAMSVVAIFSIVATMGIDGLLVRELVNRKDKIYELLGSAFLIHILGFIIVMVLLIFEINIAHSQSDDINILIIILGLATFFQAFNVIDGYFRSQVMSRYIMFANSITIVLSALIKIVLILSHAPLVYFVYAVVIDGFILACSFSYFYISIKGSLGRWQIDTVEARQLLRDGWPLILSGVVTALYMNTDKIMLNELLDSRSVGEYAVASRLSSAWYFIPMIISSSLFPAIINARNKSKKLYYERLQRLYDLVTWIAIVIAVVTTLLSDWLIDILFGDAYINSSSVLVIHIWTGVFIALWVVASKWFTLENYLQNVMYRTLIGAIVNIALNYLLIPIYGVEGAAWATLISYAFINYFSMFLFKKTRVSFYQQTKAFDLIRVLKGIKV